MVVSIQEGAGSTLVAGRPELALSSSHPSAGDEAWDQSFDVDGRRILLQEYREESSSSRILFESGWVQRLSGEGR